MQSHPENEDDLCILTDEAKAWIKAMPATMFKPKEVRQTKRIRSDEEEKVFRDANYQEHLTNWSKATQENGGVRIRLGIDTP